MPNIVDRFNIGGEEYHIEPVIDQTPEQGSQHAIASGAVWPYTYDRGDTAKASSEGIFTRNGAFDYTLGSTTATSWLMKVFGHLLGRLGWQRGTGMYSGNPTQSLEYGNGVYIATGETSGMWRSEDGKAWAKVTDLTPTDIRKVVYADGIWVCGTAMYGLWWSEDGISWTQGTGMTTTNIVYGFISHSNGLFVASTISGGGLWWSEDGKSWTQCTGIASNLNISYSSCLQCNNGLWLCGSSGKGMWWSSNGKAWTQCTGISTTASLRAITYADGLFVAGAGGGVWWSEDGKSWTQGTGDLTTYAITCVTKITDAGGASIWYAGSTSHGLWRSSNGKAWTQVSGDSSTHSFSYITYAAGTYIAFSDATGVWYSTGTTWQQGTGGNETHGFNCCVYTNGVWLVGSKTSGVWWSEDCATWHKTPTSVGVVYNMLYNNDMLIVATGGAFYWNNIESFIQSGYFTVMQSGRV